MSKLSESVRQASLAAVIGLPLVLSACGGGGGSSSSSSSSSNNSSSNTSDSSSSSEPVALVLDSSYADNQTITGSRTITLQWTTNKSGSTSLALNGSPVTVSGSNGSYSASLTLANNANVVEVAAKDAAGNTLSKTLHLDYPFIALTNGQAASVVIGQSDFVSSGAATSQGGLNSPYGNPAVHNGTLYLPDYTNSRILGFNTLPTTNGALADFVWGQPDFATNIGSTSSGAVADRLSGPQTILFSGGKTFLADFGNHRVLIWNEAPASTSGYVTADVVVGQPDATSNTSTCSQSAVGGVESIFVTGNKLIVVDSTYHRVLIWNTLPTTHGVPADQVLGQADFVSCNPNRAVAAGGDTLSYPTDAWSDGTRLFVADYGNHRVLIWNTFPTSNGQPADAVLGQPDMVSIAANVGATGMNSPYFLNANGNQLFVSDSGNIRVLVWDALPSTTGVAADHVLGQPDFTSKAVVTDQTGFRSPWGLTSIGDRLLVIDGRNNRALVFQGN